MKTHNLKGCKCPKGSDIRFCLGEQIEIVDKETKVIISGVEYEPVNKVQGFDITEIEKMLSVADTRQVIDVLNVVTNELLYRQQDVSPRGRFKV